LVIPRIVDLFDDDGGTANVNLTISRDTTFVDGPVNADGTVDYIAYINAQSAYPLDSTILNL
jgi:hypothetical protein